MLPAIKNNYRENSMSTEVKAALISGSCVIAVTIIGIVSLDIGPLTKQRAEKNSTENSSSP